MASSHMQVSCKDMGGNCEQTVFESSDELKTKEKTETNTSLLGKKTTETTEYLACPVCGSRLRIPDGF